MTNDNPKCECGCVLECHRTPGTECIICAGCDRYRPKPIPSEPKCEHDQGGYWAKSGLSPLAESYLIAEFPVCPLCKPAVEPSVEEIAKEIVNVFRKDGGIIDHENIEGDRGFMWERIAEALRNERNRK